MRSHLATSILSSLANEGGLAAFFLSLQRREKCLEEEGARMFAMTRFRLPVALIITSAFAALLAITAFSPAAKANHSWGGYHWARTANPFTLQVGDNVSSTWDSALGGAVSDWSADTAGNPLN